MNILVHGWILSRTLKRRNVVRSIRKKVMLVKNVRNLDNWLNFLKTRLSFLILILNFSISFCQTYRNVGIGTCYVSSQYDIYHHVGFSFRENKFGFNQEIGLSHKYLVISKFNWRFQEQIYYCIPLSKRCTVENGLSLGLFTQINNSTFYQLDENLFVGLQYKGFLGCFWKNYVGIMHQMKGFTHLYTTVNFISQIGISYDF